MVVGFYFSLDCAGEVDVVFVQLPFEHEFKFCISLIFLEETTQQLFFCFTLVGEQLLDVQELVAESVLLVDLGLFILKVNPSIPKENIVTIHKKRLDFLLADRFELIV